MGPLLVMAKAPGALCNLECTYCYYLEKQALFPAGDTLRMDDAVLEAFVRSYIAASEGTVVHFVWHGGEPTLRGIDFYRRAIALQRRYLPDGWSVVNNLQTNGVLLDEAWAEFLAAERWVVGVITDNRSGASGNIGADLVAKAPPDGYTLMITATTFTSNPAVTPKTPYDVVTSFAPVALIGTGGVSLSVHPGFPANTLPQFIELIRNAPGKYHYSSPGNGGPQHLSMELLKLEAKLNIVHVPYKNTAGAVTDLLAGHVQAMMLPIHTATPYVRAGKLRMLAVMSTERSAVFPEVPTVNEHGFALPSVETWYAVFAPAHTPAPIVAKLNADLNAVLREADLRESFAGQGIAPASGTPEQLGERVKREVALWSRVVKDAGIKAD